MARRVDERRATVVEKVVKSSMEVYQLHREIAERFEQERCQARIRRAMDYLQEASDYTSGIGAVLVRDAIDHMKDALTLTDEEDMLDMLADLRFDLHMVLLAGCSALLGIALQDDCREMFPEAP